MENNDDTTNYDKRELKRGWTTGACATAAARAAYLGLLSGKIPVEIEITLPGGQTPVFQVIDSKLTEDSAMAAIEKDAGDDPDITHGAIIRATLRKAEGVSFKAGPGVGMVTKPGLPLEVGEPAINPAPRQMMIDNLQSIDADFGVEIEISVDNGEALAANTWNPRLGILGGLSILGTTGVVIPYSCSAWIASIHQGIDVARATNIDHVAACTGKTSEGAVSELYGFEPTAILDMGDFAGGTLKYLRTHPIAKVTIAGGFGKLSKLAAGHMDLHSKRSQVDPVFLAKLAVEGGVAPEICDEIAEANSAGAIMEIIARDNLTLGDHVAQTAQTIALKEAHHNVDIEVLAYDRSGKLIGRAPFSGDSS